MKIKHLQQISTFLFILIFINKSLAQLGIKETNTAPNSKAMLDVESPNKGILIPRMNSSARDGITTPPDGLMIYNSETKKFNYFNNTAWQEAIFGNQWAVSGNNIYYSGGFVGIGIANPVAQLVVNGSLDANILMQQGSFTGTTATDGFLVGSDISANGIIWNYENSVLKFGTSNLERMRILANGNVGIGDTSPSEKLEVTGNMMLSGELKRTSTGNTNMIPIAYGSIQDNGNTLTTSTNWTLAHVDNSGIFDFTVTGETLGLTGYSYIATANANFPTFVVSQPVSGKLQVKTYTSAGTLQDIGFSFVIYKP